ncbi:hypothetical protein Q9W35_001739 [Salmonella enterica]|nr:hypothetical protein [Salmonella enterica subsp. enterica serovar Muenchen]ELH5514490.1 hypothetical protein [Salmonella enterica]
MQEQKRPILSIKRKPSLMYQKPPQKPDSETVNRTPRTQPEQPEQPEQLTDSGSTGTRKKPNYREPPGWEDVRGKFSDGYFNLGKMLTEMQLIQKKKKSRRDDKP